MNGERGEERLAHWRHMSLSKVMRIPACCCGYTNSKTPVGTFSLLKLEEPEIELGGEEGCLWVQYIRFCSTLYRVQQMFAPS